MFANFIITFRETLEAALVVGIVLSYLHRTKARHYRPLVWWGVAVGLAASVVGAIVFSRLTSGFTGRAEELFEGITMLAGALLLTTMIVWMLRERASVRANLEAQVERHVSNAQRLGLFLLIVTAVLREGIETTIFLNAARYALDNGVGLFGALVGLAVALVMGVLLFAGIRRVNLRRFFTATSVLLILFAAGLVSHGFHELSEAGVVEPIVDTVWDVNPAVTDGGAYPFLHENGTLGGFAKELFGYNGNPSLIELIAYVGYFGFLALVWQLAIRRPMSPQPAA